jgi:hypothetical protein
MLAPIRGTATSTGQDVARPLEMVCSPKRQDGKRLSMVRTLPEQHRNRFSWGPAASLVSDSPGL